MVKNLSLLLMAALILGVTSVPTRQRRQFEWGNNFNRGNNGGSADLISSTTSTTSTTAGTTTTRAPASFRRCAEECRTKTTQQYNPVCGSNGESYHNNARLNCASLCGANVQFVRMGTCQPL